MAAILTVKDNGFARLPLLILVPFAAIKARSFQRNPRIRQMVLSSSGHDTVAAHVLDL